MWGPEGRGEAWQESFGQGLSEFVRFECVRWGGSVGGFLEEPGGSEMRCVFTAAGLFCRVRGRNLLSCVLVLLGEEYVFAVDTVLLGELHQVQFEAVYVGVVVLVGECVFNHE